MIYKFNNIWTGLKEKSRFVKYQLVIATITGNNISPALVAQLDRALAS